MDTIRDLPTPSLLIDLDIVERNCRRMLEKAKASGVVLRPHVKTHKTIEGARLQLGAKRGPITVSTLAEGEFYAAAGFDDITYAVPISPDKLPRAASLQRRIESLHLLVDHPETVRAIEEFSRANSLSFSVFMKVDCGYHRAGVDPASDSAVELGAMIDASRHLDLAGLLTHAGHSYHATSRDEILAIAADETRAVSHLADRLGQAGIRPGIRSVGSTPTAMLVERFDDTEEVRPGNYIFFDAFQASLGSCEIEDCALTVLSSVISVYPERREVLLDAGALALSKDRGATHLDGAVPVYGLLIRDGRVRWDLEFFSVSQEHGQISAPSSAVASDLGVGEKIRVLANHSCLTAAMYDRYYVARGEAVVEEWHPAKGW